MVRIPRLLAISDRTRLEGGELGPWLDELAADGVDAVQLRERDLDDRAFYELACETRRRLPATIAVMVNRRLDVALGAGCQGAHLATDAVHTGALRRRFGAEPILGVSTHSIDEIKRARDAGADFVTYGPLRPTPSKPGWVDVPGPTGIEKASRHGIPLLVLGGVEDADDVTTAQSAGAAGVAGIRVFIDTDRRRRVVAAARHAWPDSHSPSEAQP
ncbi:MAG: thiamine phosphate synthase [Acidobacteriota bacterium]